MVRKNRRRFWFLPIAVLAIVGTVSTASAASACGTRDGKAPRACCADRPIAERACCDTNRPASPAPSSDAPAAFFVVVVNPSSCDCRASEPAAPADHQNRASSEHSKTDGFGPSAAIASSTSPPPRFDRSTLPSERPPKIPLYLQTSHLLN